jgi:hypothetical protein
MTTAEVLLDLAMVALIVACAVLYRDARDFGTVGIEPLEDDQLSAARGIANGLIFTGVLWLVGIVAWWLL